MSPGDENVEARGGKTLYLDYVITMSTVGS